MFTSPLAVIDLETTGKTATGDRFTEIGILTVVDGKVVDEWSTLVNPECSTPAEIQSLTGITNTTFTLLRYRPIPAVAIRRVI